MALLSTMEFFTLSFNSTFNPYFNRLLMSNSFLYSVAFKPLISWCTWNCRKFTTGKFINACLKVNENVLFHAWILVAIWVVTIFRDTTVLSTILFDLAAEAEDLALLIDLVVLLVLTTMFICANDKSWCYVSNLWLWYEFWVLWKDLHVVVWYSIQFFTWQIWFSAPW